MWTQIVKNPPATWETCVDPWLRRSEWQPTPVFLPGGAHGQSSLEGYSPWSRKESDTTEWLTHTHTHVNEVLSMCKMFRTAVGT